MRVLSSGVLFLSSSRWLHPVLKQNTFGLRSNSNGSSLSTSPPSPPAAPPVEKLVQRNKIYSCEFIWVIPRFRLRYDTNIVSPHFSPKDINYEWFLRLDAGKEDSKYDSENRLDLVLKQDQISYNIFGTASGECSVAIVDSKGEKHCTRRTYFRTRSPSNGSAANITLMKRSDLLNETNEPLLLPDGQLSLYCHLSFVLSSEDSIHHGFTEDYSKYFNNEERSDVVITNNGNDYPAHKFVLADRCPALQAMLEHNVVKNQKALIDIEDVDEKTFIEILRYIYTGKVENLKSMVFQLLLAADKFKLEQLKSLCEEEIRYSVSVNEKTAPKALIFAYEHNFSSLKEKILDDLRYYSEETVKFGHWHELTLHPNILMDLLQDQAKYRNECNGYSGY